MPGTSINRPGVSIGVGGTGTHFVNKGEYDLIIDLRGQEII